MSPASGGGRSRGGGGGSFLFLATFLCQGRSSLAGHLGLFLILSFHVGFAVHLGQFGRLEQEVCLIGPGGFVVGIELNCGFSLFKSTRYAFLGVVEIFLVFR